MAATMVPPALVLRRDEVSWKRVVEPVLEMENSVEEPKVAEEEPIAKAVSKVEEEARCTERVAKGEVEAMPKVPPTVALFETVS